jgi:hypothetical protein
MVFMAGFPFLLYIGAALILDPKPDSLYDSEPAAKAAGRRGGPADAVQAAADMVAGIGGVGKKAQQAQASAHDELKGSKFSKRREFQFCVRKFAMLHERLARMEAYVTSSRFKLHREFKNIS